MNEIKGYSWRSAPGSIDWTRGQHLKHGWVKARVPAFFMTRRSAIRRERLEFSLHENGQTEVVNGLGSDIKQLWHCDADGNFFYAEKIRAGQKAQLNPIENTAVFTKHPIRRLFTNNYREVDFIDEKKQPSTLQPGSYVAILSSAPFMDHGLGDRKIHLKTESMVYGFLPKEVQP